MQEQPFEVPPDRAQAVAEIGLQRWLARIGTVASLAVVGEQPGHRDEAEMGAQLLLDEQLALAVELLHGQHLLGNLVQLFDSPSGMVQVGQVGNAIAAAVEQGGGQHVGARPRGVLDEAHAAGACSRRKE